MPTIDYGYEESSCEVKTLNNEFVFVGRLKRVFEDYLVLTTDLPAAYFTSLDDNTFKVELSHGVLPNLTVVGVFEPGVRGEVNIHKLEVLSENFSREFYRVLISREGRLNLKDKDGNIKMKFKIMVDDLSFGGAKIQSVLSIPVGGDISLQILDENPVYIDGTVVRKLEACNNENAYGVQFHEKDEDKLIRLGKYMLKVQAEKRA